MDGRETNLKHGCSLQMGINREAIKMWDETWTTIEILNSRFDFLVARHSYFTLYLFRFTAIMMWDEIWTTIEVSNPQYDFLVARPNYCTLDLFCFVLRQSPKDNNFSTSSFVGHFNMIQVIKMWEETWTTFDFGSVLIHGQRRGQYGAGVTQATEFDCPEEFGYYPHPSDCTQYYVCVFGGALLESCTGGLMYSHELQTSRAPVQQQQRSQATLSREQQQQERRQRIEQEEIAKQQLYAEDLGPAEEVESDRQQRVYRGQPSSLGQVARDRDGLRHQPNTIQAPSTSRDKVSVISYATQPPPQYRPEPSAAPLQYSPQPPQPQPSPTTGRSVFAHPANTSYQPNNYDQYYAVYDDDDQLYRDVDYGHYQNNQGNSPQPFSRGNNNNNNRQEPQNVEIVNQPQQQQQQAPQRQQANNAYVSSSFNVQSQDVYSPTVSSQDYNDNYNAHVNVQYDVDDTFPQTKPSRGSVRGRGKATFTTASVPETGNRGTPSSVARGSRPTLKPSTAIVSKAQEFIDIYKYPPSRPESVYPTPTPDKSAAKCRKDVCLLPDCNCGGKDIPGDLEPEQVPQIVLLTFDDAVNDLNKGLYQDLFEKGRTNPNGCPIAATFYVSHEWTDYGQVQSLYADGHEMASHSVSHSFGEQFSQKKWTKEVAGQREILAAYGGVKQEDIRGMRAPFLAVGGNKMFKMLYDSNFTYDSSMPVYENKPPSWPYTLDYKLFHDCMIPPCPTRSYPGVWEVPMVMWTDLNGGRCSMGDACSNPPTSDGVYKMLIKNFERHYTTNRAPFGLFYHAAWFTQPHHKEGFIAFLDTLVSMNDVWLVTNWQALQWVRDPTPISRLNNFQPFQCNYQDRPRRCNNPKVCNLWHKSGVRYMRTCQPCPDVYPWTGKSGVRNSRVDNDIGTD
ncbi:uncharacterized protein LOC117652726 [Thrips palmi]|uniref:Uncharacterized protein LOC117652726 n=1 Tax=Thrips palmi TaxID=161013 RepID=A0A6P9A8W3_THRPL|nr:uncharacterized protein LOC117652726 [Thrips palmi]